MPAASLIANTNHARARFECNWLSAELASLVSPASSALLTATFSPGVIDGDARFPNFSLFFPPTSPYGSQCQFPGVRGYHTVLAEQALDLPQCPSIYDQNRRFRLFP